MVIISFLALCLITANCPPLFWNLCQFQINTRESRSIAKSPVSSLIYEWQLPFLNASFFLSYVCFHCEHLNPILRNVWGTVENTSLICSQLRKWEAWVLLFALILIGFWLSVGQRCTSKCLKIALWTNSPNLSHLLISMVEPLLPWPIWGSNMTLPNAELGRDAQWHTIICSLHPTDINKT